MKAIPSTRIIAVIAIIVMILDLYTKFATFVYLTHHHENIEKIFSFFNIVKVWNHGVSFGMFQNPHYGRIIFPILSLVIIGLLLWQSKTMVYRSQFAATGMIIGGALGNNIDRIINGAVADFLDFHIFGYHWPAFNIADSFICIGVFILLLCEFCAIKKNNKQIIK